MHWDYFGNTSFGFAGNVGLEERNAFQRRLETNFSSYMINCITLLKTTW